ncbi:MAG: FMN-binding glutamate synthase family protein, partial [Pseudomonadota bacterium]
MVWLPEWIVSAMDLLVALFVLTVGLITLTIAIVFVADSTQTKDAILRNYPVVGHFRYAFSTLGEFFRQYFFAMDREELPFNRSEREWVKRASLNEDNTVAFGSTRSLKVPGTPIFVNCPFPTLERDASKTEPLLFGPYCETPYSSRSILNISGMSFGAISKPAILALSNGARMAGCWMNTGEGALSPHHLEGGADIVFQIGTAKYGVRTEDGRLCEDKLREVAAHPNVKMFEIKLSQGAKPGKGGILPGEKVTAEIAAVRGIPEGQDSISPNRHPEVDSVDDLLDFIDRVRRITGKPVGFKTVVGAYGWLENL